MKVVILTHHKTGTVFWRKVFQKVCKSYDLNFLNASQLDSSSNKNILKIATKNEWDVYFNRHGELPQAIRDCDDYAVVHSMRNPAQIIYSSVKYHKDSTEEWLHLPKKQFDGLTYQQKICSLESFEDQLIFEISHASGRVIKRMVNLSKSRDFFHVDIDLLSSDINMNTCRTLYYYLRLEEIGISIRKWMEIVRSNSLWFDENAAGKHQRTSQKERKSDVIASFGKRSRNAFKKRLGENLFTATFIDEL